MSQRDNPLILEFSTGHGFYTVRFKINCATDFQILVLISNSYTLIGDLVFKLNPGPTGERIPVIVSTRSDYRHIAQLTMPSCNAGNLININCSAGLSLNGYYNHPLTLCTFNARSVKNKSAAILDYISDCKPDLFAITETWPSADNAAVRAELCPDG